MTVRPVAPADLYAQLRDGGEIALVDPRPAADFARGHLMMAVNLPAEVLATQIRGFVPRRATRLVLTDGADTAERALEEVGYNDVQRLDGGTAAWGAAGHELFESSYTMANGFGLHVEARDGTPRLDGGQLMARQAAGAEPLIVDSRPWEDYRQATVPGAVNVPLAELVYAVHDLAPDPEREIVVHCGGKARGILGAQSLIDLGLPNPVLALDEGTMDWVMAGGTLERGADRGMAAPSAEARTAGVAAAARFEVPLISETELARWQAEAGARTLYLVDVRSRAEYEAGHLPAARWIAGGQLASCTDDYLATRNARICLVDDDGARARLTAHWLRQAGWAETAVLEGGLTGRDLESSPDPLVPPQEEAAPAPAPADPAALAERYRRVAAWRRGLLAQVRRDGSAPFAP